MFHRFWKGFSYALAGIRYCIRTQCNMRLHFLAAAVVLILSFYVSLRVWEWMFIIFAITGVIAAEMFNTAIEAVVDLYTKDHHPLAKTAKDVAAGAVLITAANALLVGYLILWPHLVH